MSEVDAKGGMRIEIWADVTCPWCGLGTHRLDAAVRRFAHADQVAVVHRSFQLDPGAPAGVAEPTATTLARLKGMDPRQIRESTRFIEKLAHDEGLAEYHVADNDVGNTGLAHELLAYASERGLNEPAWQLVFAEYFGATAPIWTVEDLLPIAGRLGLDPGETRQVLTDRRFRARVADDGAEARRLGATGVPFVVVDRRYGMAGAQTPARVLAMIERAWADSNPALSA